MIPLTPRNIRAAVVLAAAAAVVTIGVAVVRDDAPAAAAPAPVLEPAVLKTLRNATRPFRIVDAAIAAGYEPTDVCVELPDGSAAMGYHYVNEAYLLDGVNDPTKPDILLYVPTPTGGLKLGGVEFFQPDTDQDLTTDDDRPSFEGHPFDGPMEGHEPGMPVHYDLHIWLYQHNPDGMLTGFNPSVSCEPGHLHGWHPGH